MASRTIAPQLPGCDSAGSHFGQAKDPPTVAFRGSRVAHEGKNPERQLVRLPLGGVCWMPFWSRAAHQPGVRLCTEGQRRDHHRLIVAAADCA